MTVKQVSRRPGLTLSRYRRLIEASIAELHLDLRGASVLTEAASGPYMATAVIAAAAGADVIAVTRTSHHGTEEEIRTMTLDLACLVGGTGRISIRTDKSPELFAAADIVTNSGHVRPLDSAAVQAMKASAVIPLMYEAWEFRNGDVDLDTCRLCGIPVGGTNERHPAIDVFSYLGILAVKLLLDASIAVYRSNIVLLCDNDFGPYIRKGLEAAGARLESAVTSATDAVVVAMTPRGNSVLSIDDVERIATISPSAILVQYWGDLDRVCIAEAGLALWPPQAPLTGHMGILPSVLGPEPIVRLQAGGLKVGEILWRARRDGLDSAGAAAVLERSGFGVAL